MRANRRGVHATRWLICSFAALLIALVLRLQHQLYVDASVIAWLIALATFLVAGALWDHQRPGLHPLDLDWTPRDTICVLIAFGLAIALRFPALGRLPLTLLGDEAAMGLEAARVNTHALVDPFGLGWGSHPALWFFLQAFCLRLVGDPIAGLRALSALIGSLTVATSYVCVRLWQSWHVAAITALLRNLSLSYSFQSIGAVQYRRPPVRNGDLLSLADRVPHTACACVGVGGSRWGSHSISIPEHVCFSSSWVCSAWFRCPVCSVVFDSATGRLCSCSAVGRWGSADRVSALAQKRILLTSGVYSACARRHNYRAGMASRGGTRYGTYPGRVLVDQVTALVAGVYILSQHRWFL